MKHLTVAFILLLAIVHSSFVSKEHTATYSMRTKPPAVTYSSNEFIDVTEFAEIPCAGESVILQGRLHMLTHYTVTGNNVVSYVSYQSQGISGVGSVSGDKYRSTGVTQEVFKGSFKNNQYTATSINNFRIIGQGPGNNYTVHSVLHVTFNANGTVTAKFDKAMIDCK